MIEINCVTCTLRLNGAPLSDSEREQLVDVLSIQELSANEIEEIVQHEIKMRGIHAQIIARDENELIAQMVEEDPNGWFIDYCELSGIEI